MIQSPTAPPFTSSFPNSLNFHHLQFPDESFLRTNLNTMFQCSMLAPTQSDRREQVVTAVIIQTKDKLRVAR